MPKGKEDLVFSFIPKYNKFQEYYDVLGPKRLKALGYAKGSIEKEMKEKLLDKSDINREILSKFNVGDKITSVETKSIITENQKKVVSIICCNRRILFLSSVLNSRHEPSFLTADADGTLYLLSRAAEPP